MGFKTYPPEPANMPSLSIMPSSHRCQLSATIWMPFLQNSTGSRFEDLILSPDG